MSLPPNRTGGRAPLQLHYAFTLIPAGFVAYPGERVGTSIAIRGAYGDGKSIVFEKLIGTILGDMMLRVANHKMILGDFNPAPIYRRNRRFST